MRSSRLRRPRTPDAEELAHTGGSLNAAVLGAGLLAGGAGLVIARRRAGA